MKFANEAMFGNEHGQENERKFMDMLKVIELRNGLKSEAAFKNQANIIQQVITATGGRVQAGEWLNAIKTGGVAVKGLTNEAFTTRWNLLFRSLVVIASVRRPCLHIKIFIKGELPNEPPII